MRKFESSGKKKNGKNHVQGIQCYECNIYGHIVQECPNKNKKNEAFTITPWDDTREFEDSHDEEGESGGDDGNFVVLSHMSTVESNPSG